MTFQPSAKLQKNCNIKIQTSTHVKYSSQQTEKNTISLSLENIRNNADDLGKKHLQKEIIKDVYHLHKLRYIAWKITGINDDENIYRKHPVSICGKYPFRDSNIELWSNENNSKTHLKNLCSCNSVWACPIDRFKIMSVRTSEIISISKGEQQNGKYIAFLTLTRKHRRHKSLTELQKFFKNYNVDFRYITSIPSIKSEKENGFTYIKAYETMYNSKHGFHPHFHLILFANSREALERIANKIITAWLSRSKGSTRINQKLIHVYDNPDEQLEKYISKMNMALELTNLYSNKSGKYFSINPLDALNLLLKKDYSVFSESELKKLYNEYIYCTRGLRSITMSKGLKAKYKIAEKTDEQICNDDSELKNEIVKISYSLYSRLVRISATHELLKAGDNYLKNDSTILIELRKILTDRLLIPIQYYQNQIVCSDEVNQDAPEKMVRSKTRTKTKTNQFESYFIAPAMKITDIWEN